MTKRDAGPAYWRWPVTLGANQTVHLLLLPNTALTEQLAPSMREEIGLQPHTFLTGEVEGYPAPLSSVSLSVKTFDEFMGRVTIGDTTYHLELLRLADGKTQVVVYNSEDVQDDPDTPMHCLTNTTAPHQHDGPRTAGHLHDATSKYDRILPTASSLFRMENTPHVFSAAAADNLHTLEKRGLNLPSGTTPTNVDCPMYLVSDFAFTASVGGPKPAAWTMLSIVYAFLLYRMYPYHS